MQEYFIGLDVHQRSWSVTILLGRERIFGGRISVVVADLLAIFERHGVHAGNSHLAYEVGGSGFWIYDQLTALGYRVAVVAPNRIPREPTRKIKTDPRDSMELARLLQAGLVRSIVVPTLEERAVRELVRTRKYFVRNRAKIIQRVKSRLSYLGVDYGTRMWSQEFEMWTLEQPMPVEYREMIRRLFSVMATLKTEIRRVEEEIAAIMGRTGLATLYRSVPGIGVQTAAVLVTELRDLRRFETPEELASYVGICPSEHSSGEHVHRGRITRQGNRVVRSALVESSWMLIRKDATMRAFYNRIAARQGGKRAIVAVARKLLHALWAMNRTGECFRVAKAA